MGVIDNPVTRASPDTLLDGVSGALEVLSDDGFSLYAAGYAIVGTVTTTSLQTRDGVTSVTLDDAQGVNIGGGYQQATPLAGLTWLSVSGGVVQVQAGRIKALAVGSLGSARWPSSPHAVPAVACE